ncbi:MAG: helix-turn-helix domain-containing protein [Dysgonamonadaceae bacterium]|jgi:AraC-like DNA-binding protein|nr:helix-turn-helix domain-containing protein [Dysgonamonadaceae bacterium]
MNSRDERLYGKFCPLDCPYCQNGIDDFFEILEEPEGGKLRHRSKSIALTFLTKGEIELSINDSKTRKVVEDEFFIIPNHADFCFYSVRDSSLLCLYIKVETEFCKQIRDKIFANPVKVENSEGIVLKMNGIIHDFVSNFLKLINEGLICKIHITSFVIEIVTMISIFYPLDLLEQFFAPMFSANSYRLVCDIDFRSKVLQHKNKVFTVKEMANLLNMGKDTFRNNFIRIFGITPKLWIQNERKELIYNELSAENKTMQNIAELAGFATERQLYKFSKNNFGKTVLHIRKSTAK